MNRNNAQGDQGHHNHDQSANGSNNNNHSQPPYQQQQQQTGGWGPTPQNTNNHHNTSNPPAQRSRRNSFTVAPQPPRTQSQSTSAGVQKTRLNDNSKPGLNSRVRDMKKISDAVKKKLEELIEVIDELQPDTEGMDWQGSAGTIFYVPVQRAADGSFLHPQIRSIREGVFPNTAEGFGGSGETGNGTAGVGGGYGTGTPVAAASGGESMGARTSETAVHASAGRSSTVTAGEGSVAGKDASVTDLGRATASTVRDDSGRAAQGDAVRSRGLNEPISNLSLPTELGESNLNRGHGQVNGYTAPDSLNRRYQPNTNLGGQSTNQAQAWVTSFRTPPESPESPPRGWNHARVEDERASM
jgi:hypothetical protein